MIFYYSYESWEGKITLKCGYNQYYEWSVVEIIGNSDYTIEKVTI